MDAEAQGVVSTAKSQRIFVQNYVE